MCPGQGPTAASPCCSRRCSGRWSPPCQSKPWRGWWASTTQGCGACCITMWTRRGHDYITLFVDIDQARVVFATEGKDAETVAAFAEDLATHGGNAETRNPTTLSGRQRATLDALPTRHLKTARAYQIRLVFQDFYNQPSAEAGAGFLKKWYFWATHSRLEPMIDAARTVKHHWDGILHWFDSKIANGLIEGINSLVQAAKARGYRSTRNLKAMVYLIAGKLDLALPA